ncbi:SMC5-like protein [Echria macrotheca]|uniref:Structural maintenance of chromosomes protein 5 n=1 Tax=Echria macrotheca TaxID=438768 RepID=A0AAJ0BMC5_9PEZI|nr:SMC5-like protein [Echria macrotheca]
METRRDFLFPAPVVILFNLAFLDPPSLSTKVSHALGFYRLIGILSIREVDGHLSTVNMAGLAAERTDSSLENQTKIDTALPSSRNDDFEHLRLRGGDGRSMESGEEEDSEDEMPARRSGVRRVNAAQRTNGLSRTEFQPGAIVRVKVQNFVTYEKAEFSLGPNLNMVIGPNGTGKSSLVCAICLGLGYPSSVLGRASAFSDFVKHGKDEADIAVELQRRPEDAENYVVGLCIRREDNSRKFTINGNRATLKDIQQLMRSLRIQIDNLCQFLPQDKVAEFAGLTPVELLEKTLHAAAPPEMIEWQGSLKEYFAAQKEAQRGADSSRENLRNMQTRQQVLQADVEKLQERKNIQENIEKLEGLHVVLRYSEARKAYSDAKERRKATEANLRALQRSSAPSLEAVTKKQEYQDRILAVVNDRKTILRAAETAAKDALGMVDNADKEAKQHIQNAEAAKKIINDKKAEIGALRKKITSLEAQYKQVPPEFDAAEYNRKIREKEAIQRDKYEEAKGFREAADQLREEGRENNVQQKKLNDELQNLESQQGQLTSFLRKIHADSARGWEWLKENQDKFEKEVFGPPMLSCSVKDPRYSDLVQSALAFQDFICFTTQTKNDHIKLSNQFYGEMKLKVTLRSCLRSLDAFQPPMSRNELVQYGFDGYALDYLDGPEPVLAMLCSEKKIHMSAVGLRALQDPQVDRVLQDEKINQFACGGRTYRVTRRREYGPSAVTTRIDMLQKGRFWTGQAVDATEKAEVEAKLNELVAKNKEIKVKFKENEKRAAELESEARDFDEKIQSIRNTKAELQKVLITWRTLPERIETEKSKLRQKETGMHEAKETIRESERLQGVAVLNKAKAVLLHHRKIQAMRTAWHDLLNAQMLLIEAKSDVSHLKDRSSEILKRLDEEKVALDALKRQVEQKKEIAAAAFEAIATLDEAYRAQIVQEAHGRTAQDIDAELAAERAKLEVIQANNPMALEEFETWARRIAREEVDFKEKEARVKDLAEKIESLKSRFEPRLDGLISEINDAFSYNFEQISCAGEVGVNKDEDFAKWAIEIRVRFREGETLQRLDQHRQSGGERAVSTIFYLMSLQSMAQAPFRVVDEINQGMDPRNERMVHERMVEIACREHTSQYFLITPKLLPGLRYDERMRVHTIVSGEHVDEDGTEKMNFAKFAKIQRRVMGRR